MSIQPVIAITLGSNGFHLIEVAEINGKMETTHHIYESVQAEFYLDENQCFSEEGQSKILQSLNGFATYLADNPAQYRAAIATGSFRRARNASALISNISDLLGLSVKVLSGEQEGLLCYLGIASSIGFAKHNRLVIDIGGGSTEIMIAKDNTLISFCSLDLGCVSLSQVAFPDGTVNDQSFALAKNLADEVILPYKAQFQSHGWQELIGCGGTVSSLFSILQTKRLCARAITAASLQRFRDTVVTTGSATQFCEPLVPAKCALTLPAGISIISAIFDSFETDRLNPVFSSVGQGLLVQLIRQQNRSIKDEQPV